MKLNNNQQAFLELVRAGLWETDACLLPYGDIDFQEIYRLAQEQSVVGLVAAGLEHVVDIKAPQKIVLQFVGQTLQFEQSNTAMNSFISDLINKLRGANIYTLLVKGQGIALCYERPAWRACGDVDLFLNEENYNKAIDFLTPIADKVVDNTIETKHYSMLFGQWEVELHGTLHSQISKRIDSVVDEIQEETFRNGEVRKWYNGKTVVFLPSPDNDIIFVFTHILQHFFLGGIGLRQLCDTTRLLWTYRDCIDKNILNERLSKMGILKEWKSFGNLIVNVLGLSFEAMPFYDDSYSDKAGRILSYIIDVGNFGHNKDISYQYNDRVIQRKMRTFLRQTEDSFRLMHIFPKNSMASLFNYLAYGTKKLSKG